MSRWILAAAALSLSMGSSIALQAKVPDTWDGLSRVQSKRFNVVYVLPSADFRTYTKVMIDPPQIAFKKDWKKDYNSTQRDLGRRVGDKDVRRAIDEAGKEFAEILTKEYNKAGYQVVDQPEADVLRISTAVINIEVNAPDIMSAGRSRTFTTETGEATVVIEARDSVSGSLIGRALDRSIIGDNGGRLQWSNSVDNRAEFEIAFKRWAKASAEGLDKLKAFSARSP